MELPTSCACCGYLTITENPRGFILTETRRLAVSNENSGAKLPPAFHVMVPPAARSADFIIDVFIRFSP
jgi:hypothetical protein